jgi:hypothetical protein
VKRSSIAVFLIGVLLGFGVGFVYSSTIDWTGRTPASKSWHELTSFVLVSNSPPMQGVEIAYSYPNVQNDTGPSFNITTDFWRVKLETVPYYTYHGDIAYYTPVPLSLRVYRPFPILKAVGPITLFEPLVYNVSSNVWQYDSFLSHLRRGAQYLPVKANYTFFGAGTYAITFAEGITVINRTASFSLTIEQYY